MVNRITRQSLITRSIDNVDHCFVTNFDNWITARFGIGGREYIWEFDGTSRRDRDECLKHIGKTAESGGAFTWSHAATMTQLVRDAFGGW